MTKAAKAVPIRVVHAVGWYLPDSMGGTERYVAGLCAALRKHSIESVVVVPSDANSTGEVDGVRVHRYAVEPRPSRQEVRQQASGVVEFGALLRSLDAGIYHQHSVTRGLHLEHLRSARAAGMRTMHTMHTATPICLRETLMLNGAIECDGEIRVGRCSRCWLASRERAAAWSYVPALAGELALAAFPESRISTALSTRTAVSRHRQALIELLGGADITIVPSRWQSSMLARNGSGRVEVLESAIADEFGADVRARPTGPLTIGFVGRVEPMKGLHVLLEALEPMCRASTVRLHVVVALPPSESPHMAYAERTLEAARKLGATITTGAGAHTVAEIVASCDVLAIPSQTLETGPLVALEAAALGTWIIGSALGGVRERVGGQIGETVEAGSIYGWRRAFERALNQRDARRSIRAPHTVRRMSTLATEHAELYRELHR